jgi:hypothetical protein
MLRTFYLRAATLAIGLGASAGQSARAQHERVEHFMKCACAKDCRDMLKHLGK